MKIGIMTYPLRDNYGGILQNFALQFVLKQLGHSPITIQWVHSFNNWLKYLWGMLVVVRVRLKGLRMNYPTIPGRMPQDSKEKGRRRFVKEHITLSQPVRLDNIDSLIQSEGIEAMVAGSDQVWRNDMMSAIDWMFLPFNSFCGSRIAYGASFGVNEPQFGKEQIENYTSLLSKFKAISVREKEGIDICKNCFKAEAELVLAPTLLLDRNVYLKLCDKEQKHKNPILFAYILDPTSAKTEKCKKMANELGTDIIYKSLIGEKKDTVEEWLSLFRDARYVVTDSYHGFLFSLIFDKEFTFFYNSDRGNSRINSIIDILDLNRFFLEKTDVMISLKINDSDFDEKLHFWRQVSYRFLENSLNN